MSKSDILEEIEKLERKQFYNKMEDHWSDENFRIERECSDRLKELRSMLGEMESD